MAKPLFESSKIRNIALLGHGSSGKTSIAEAMLFNTQATNRLGVTTAGTSTLDFEPEEQARGGSIATAFAWVTHKGNKINIIDTPGDGNFIYDSLAAMRGADTAVIVISCPDGVEVQTERVFKEAQELNMPTIIVVNKMDRERANPDAVLTEINELLGVKPVPLQVPIGKETAFQGVVSLLQKKALKYADDTSGSSVKEDIPSELADAVESATENLTESVAESDEALLEKYLETFELSEEELRNALSKAVNNGSIVPVLFTAASANMGIDALIELVSWAAPSPLERKPFAATTSASDEIEINASPEGDFVAQVIHSHYDEYSGKLSIFRVISGSAPEDGVVINRRTGEEERLGSVYSLRGTQRDATDKAVCGDILAVAKLKETSTNDTVAGLDVDITMPIIDYPDPMMRYTISATSKGDEDKLKTAVDKLIEEDPTLGVSYDHLSRKLVLSGMGQAHLDLAIAKMGRKFKVAAESDLPLVPYRETLKKAVMNVEGKHKKQSGGAGQFGVCYINVIPLPRGEGFQFEDKIVGGAIPRQYIPSVEKGISERMKSGPLAGYPVVDLKVELTDGKYHPVDSKDVAYQAAGSKGIRAALQQGGIKLLEPYYLMNIAVPTENMGDVMGDINSRRGRVLGMETRGKMTFIRAMAPLSEIQRYAPDLRSMTGGKGTFIMEFHGYEEVPSHLTDTIVKESPFRDEEEE